MTESLLEQRTSAPEPSLDLIARRLQTAIGLRPGGVSALRLRHAAREVAARRGVTPAALADLLATDPTCRQQLVDRVTVQESQFFRDAPFFAALQSTILPSLGAADEAVTVWSAGCALGQEAYSVAMLLAESPRTAWRVLGTDVSARALAIARSASFGERELRGLSAARRDRFLSATGDGRHVLAPAIRDRVRFAAHNLIGDPPPPGAVEARLVLLRNVLIYFEPATVRAVLRRLSQTLPAGAWILLGGSEVLHPLAGLELVRVAGIYGYRVTGRPASAPTAASTPGVAVAPVVSATRVAAAAPVAPEPAPDDLRVRGERHAAAGEHADAIRCFRQLVYLDGRDVGARLALALSFEAAGDVSAAVRSLRATATAIAEVGGNSIRWPAHELLALIDDRLATLKGAR